MSVGMPKNGQNNVEYIKKNSANGTITSKNFLNKVEQRKEMEEADFYDTIHAGNLVLFCSRPRNTGRERLIRSHSSARFCFESSGNSNEPMPCNSNFGQNFELEISLN